MGTFPTDCSPYGVRDIAGGMREWVGDVHGERTAEEALAEREPAPDSERGESPARVVRSGNCRLDGRVVPLRRALATRSR